MKRIFIPVRDSAIMLISCDKARQQPGVKVQLITEDVGIVVNAK